MSGLYKISSYFLFCLLTFFLLFSSCKKDEDNMTEGIQLLSFGPSPALRGSELKIIGTNLDQVVEVVLANNVSVTSFNSKTSEKITLTIPEATVDGPITLKTSSGDIKSSTLLSISEPIVINSLAPEIVKVGQTLTINGDYLNLINTVIFADNVSIGDTMFITHTREKIELVVPEQAQTGYVIVSNGALDPIEVVSETVLNVKAPQVTSIAPNPIKAETILTITGTDLDLVKQIGFAGTSSVSDFISQTETQIQVSVPADAADGDVLLIPGSFLEIPANEPLIMVVPQITSVLPNPAKSNNLITITGIDLDLTSKAIFGNNKFGFITSKTETEMKIRVPPTATEDFLILQTAAEKQVSTAEILTLIQPSITGFSPVLPEIGEELTIMGMDLDIINKVIFSGNVEANTNNSFIDNATVDIPMGALSGPVTIVMLNGTEVTSTVELELSVTTNAVINQMPTLASIGEMIRIRGTNLNEINEVIFPFEVSATMFGIKTDTLIEVFVPQGAASGIGNIKFITFGGEEFFSPNINIQGVDPVVDPSLVFFNFDGLDGWWGDVGAIENDPTISLDGSSYFRVNAMLSDWNGFFWRNGGDNFPGATIGTNVDDYLLKFDLNIMDPMTGGSITWRLKGSEGDFFYNYQPWQTAGSFMTNGWITVSIPLNEFLDGVNQISDLNNIDADFGAAFDSGDSQINLAIDNVRFEEQ